MEAHKIASDLRDGKRFGRIMAGLSTLNMTRGDIETALACAREAAAQGDIGNKALGLPAIGSHTQALGRHGEAIQRFREAIEFVSGSMLYERFGQMLASSVFAHSGLAISLAETGQFEAAMRAGKTAVEIAEHGSLPFANLAYALTASAERICGRATSPRQRISSNAGSRSAASSN